MSTTLWILAGIEVAVLALLLGLMLVRKLHSVLPVFFNYVAVTLLMVIVLLVSMALGFCGSPPYFYIYWSLTALNTLLVFGVLYEVFKNLLQRYSAVLDLGKMLFRWAAVFLLFTAVLTALTTRGSEPNKIVAAIQLLERSCELMQCGLLLLLLTFQTRMGISWRSHGMAIALALGGYSAFDMSMSYLGTRFPAWGHGLDLANGLVSVGMFAFLAVALWLPQPERRRAQDSPKRLVLERWNDVLAGAGFGGGPITANSVSFIPGVEQTVERVLSRKMVH